jgi:hypothetical protein
MRSQARLSEGHPGRSTAKKESVYAAIRLPYLTVDGRLRVAHDEHRAHGAQLVIQTDFETEPVTGHLLCRAVVTSSLLGTAQAHARAFLDGRGVNATNPVENAETSAVGRALGFLGYGLFGTGVASADEVLAARAVRDQPEREPTQHPAETASNAETPPDGDTSEALPSERQLAYLRDLVHARGGLDAQQCAALLATIRTRTQASALIDRYQASPDTSATAAA